MKQSLESLNKWLPKENRGDEARMRCFLIDPSVLAICILHKAWAPRNKTSRGECSHFWNEKVGFERG